MYRLPLIILLVIFARLSFAQSPHGEGLGMDCVACHTTDGWEIPSENWNFTEEPQFIISQTTGIETVIVDSSFNHFDTDFPLAGSHDKVDCRSCHSTLIFNEASTQCIDCHLDVHQMTVGNDCIRCHTSETWLVDNIPEIHEENGFPLIGSHSNLSCVDCHISETSIRFDRIGNDCISCHQDDFNMTTSPNHVDVGFSTNCLDCHSPEGDTWDTDIVDHSFFPLTLGHDIQDCKLCHITNNFSDASPECISCHQENFTNTSDPDHEALAFSNDCIQCHTTNPGWMPAEYVDHDGFFPIYSGAHEGVWSDCIDCHTDPNDIKVFTCVNCHINPETDDEHDGITGYVYENNACLACHPTGDTDMAFNHDETNFPLTGSHIGVDCLECHSNGFEGTSTNCVDCHGMDFDGAINPNHVELNLPNDCASCHTTDPDWMPATFGIHDDYYPLEGAHALIANDCVSCHNGDYVNTPNTCIGCHLDDFNSTMDPDHEAANFSTNCLECHTLDAWEPSTFDHDVQHFPIYSGAHEGEWSVCTDCHTNPSNFQEFQCINCHINPETDEDHEGVSGYVYEDNACFACHPTGNSDMSFNHDETNFPLTGAHLGIDCLECHSNGFEGTSSNCVDCHEMDFDAAINPNHQELNLPNDCASCHTTDPGWMPATFAIHDDFYPLEGAHAMIANDCASCHNGDYVNTPNTCIGCHLDDFNSTMDPDHEAANFSTDCLECHTLDAWEPSTFDHDVQHFPIYSGTHEGEWSVCTDCHTNPSNFQEFQCINCHINPETDEDHEGVSGYIYEDNACFACHPTGNSDMSFNHDETNFPLSGAHLGIDCLECHSNGFEGTSMDCNDCHNTDFLASTNPNHTDLGISTDCITCHTTDPGWVPATFDIHDDYYPLTGAHAAIASDCATCHNGDYNNTPNTCVGCHQMDFDGTVNPNHQTLNLSTDCASCHTTDPEWMPATFDIHDDFYPLVGAHAAIANDCAACHNGDYNNTPNTCIGCHQLDYDNTIDPDHAAAMFPTDCTQCHDESAWEPSTFDHDGQNFPIYSGAHDGEWSACMDCHTDPNNFLIFTCIGCHINPETDDGHNGVGGYIYEDNACLACHPTGEAEEGIDHDATAFPLTGAHITADCIDCHANGYVGTSTDCNDCHNTDYVAATNPNHVDLGLSTDCASCHTTDPGWSPATFDIHDDYYVLTGAHITIASDCAACHNGDYINTPNDCMGCHLTDYNSSINPNHSDLNIPTDCASCHTTDPGWSPATFDIHDDYYPLTGAHVPIASDCAACHNGDYTNTPNQCSGCHITDYNGSTNPNHSSLNLPTDCVSCHTTDPDWMPATFDIHDDYYALNGAHAIIANDCAACHNGDYNNTPNTCIGCHQSDFNGTTNPNHVDAMFSNECLDCHTETAWIPSTFDHSSFYPLLGAHADIANDCLACHSNGYENTPNTCYGCHQSDYDNTTDPNHSTAGFPTDCTQCHNEDAWDPSTFDHDGMYFPIYSGKHEGEWNSCTDCHFDANDYNLFTCIECHEHDDPVDLAGKHDDVPDYQYESNACYACHPTGEN